MNDSSLGDSEDPHVPSSPLQQNPRALANRGPGGVHIVDKKQHLSLYPPVILYSESSLHTLEPVGHGKRHLRRDVFHFHKLLVQRSDSGKLSKFFGDYSGVVVSPHSFPFRMKGNRDNGINIPPESLLLLEAVKNYAGYPISQNRQIVKFAEQNNILQFAPISAAGAVHGKGWFFLEARGTQMRFIDAVKESSAAQTESGLLELYALPAVMADYSLLWRFEISRTQPAIGRKED